MHWPTVLQNCDIKNTLEHAENKNIETYKGANECETAKTTLTRGRRLIERNKHLNLFKQTKQKEKKKAKGKTNNRKNVQLASYSHEKETNRPENKKKNVNLET